MLTEKRYKKIMGLVNTYNRNNFEKKGYVSPFIARAHGHLDKIAKKIGVPVVKELDEFLTRANKELYDIE